MKIESGIHFSKAQLIELYEDAGWTTYLRDKDRLWEAIQRSLDHVSIMEDDMLIAYLRILGDGLYAIFIQDLIVKKSHRGLGFGSRLLSLVREKYPDVRQIVAISYQNEKLKSFYAKNGMKDTGEFDCLCHASID